MADSVGIRALQQHASAVVARVARGEIVDVTDRGRPVARLVPMAYGRLAGLVAAGLARPARRRVSDLARPLPALEEGPTLGELLADARADER
jgi:prevent-host-death family protein